ncbi:gliding motility-associated C-terminal domain-containing protein [Ferruginibacter sp.]|uniref:T9SS type B sorting domain-containing protein n=1 Tax=Ferruginibacter sp. TaxID=1940288 RepID=UPI002658BCF0|nr:gliding motility-associated C-terminal domain-containing protein [Ferruginibacter sp.]
MKRLCITLCLFTCFFSVRAQAPTLQWVRTFGSDANDFATAVAIEKNGDVITAGYFAGTIDFDPGPGVYNLTTNGHFDFFVLKLDAAGNFIWAKSFGNTRADEAIALKLDNNGNVYITGAFDETVDFDPGPGVYNLPLSGPNGFEAFMLKLNSNGDFVWARNWFNADLMSIEIDGTGNIYATGPFFGTADFDPGPGVHNLTEYSLDTYNVVLDIYVLKLDAAGNFQWVKQMGGKSTDQAQSIKLDAQGNILTTGTFQGTADFDPGPGTFNLTATGALDIFISKLDANGNFIWAKQVGGTLEDRGRDIEADVDGNVYVCGSFASIVDFNPGTGTFNLDGNDTAGTSFILKLDGAGNYVWAKQFGTGFGSCDAIELDNAGNVYTTGNFQGDSDFDPGPGTFNLNSNGQIAIFISKLDNDGNLIWAGQMAASGNYNVGLDVQVDQTGNIYTSGFFWETVDFDPGPPVYNVTMVATGDAYVQKLSQCKNITYASINANACSSYTLNNKTYTATGIYRQTRLNSSGCDSIITLNLTIGGFQATFSATACNNYAWQGKTYTNSGMYTAQYKDIYGCDSVLNLDLTIKKGINTVVDTAICEGETYSGHNTTGSFTDLFNAINGCDSSRLLHLTIKKKSVSTIRATICEGESYESYDASGTYTNIFTSSNGCDSTRTLYLLVNPKKHTGKDVTICEGEKCFAAGKDQYSSGIYSDTLQSYTGCDSVIITTLTVTPKPRPYLGQDKNLCTGNSITFNPGVFASYQWQDMSTSPSYIATNTGLFWVKVTDNRNCSAIDTVYINAIAPLPFNFLKQTDSICTFEKLTVQPINSYSAYLWSTGSTSNSITIQAPGSYILAVTDANGCKGTDTITVFPRQCITDVFVPTAFSPNGDGKNDLFRTTAFGTVQSFKLEVYDRWGKLVFESNDPNKAWDGLYKGRPYATTAFVWRCMYQLGGQSAVSKKGTLLLVR